MAILGVRAFGRFRRQSIFVWQSPSKSYSSRNWTTTLWYEMVMAPQVPLLANIALVPAVLLLCSRVGDQLFYKRCLLFSVQVINLASRIGPLIQVRLSYNICFERKTQICMVDVWFVHAFYNHCIFWTEVASYPIVTTTIIIIIIISSSSSPSSSSSSWSLSSSSSSLQHDHFWQYCLQHCYGRCHQSAFECDYLMRKKRICLGEKRNRKMLTNIL